MWMNDGGFWIIAKVSGFTEAEMLKSATVMMTIMGVVWSIYGIGYLGPAASWEVYRCTQRRRSTTTATIC